MLIAALQSETHSCEEVQDAINEATDEEINFASPGSLFTPLHHACTHLVCETCFKSLLRRGAFVNALTYHGHCPLMKLCKLLFVSLDTKYRLIKILLEHGAIPSKSVMHYLALNGYDEILSLILHYNKEFHSLLDEDGRTPLHVAANFKETKCCEILIDAGCDLEQKSGNGSTPLTYLFSRGIPWYPAEIECGRFLIDRGAKLENVYSDIIIPKWALEYAKRRTEFQNRIATWILTTRQNRLLRIIGKDMVREIALEIWNRRLQ